MDSERIDGLSMDIEELHIHTKTRRTYINITREVESALAESGIREGLCLVNGCTLRPASSSTIETSDRNQR
jgi:thiamine phosphate synthase YjbQ (UPF0047 family)